MSDITVTNPALAPNHTGIRCTRQPIAQKRSAQFELWINGEPVDVLHAEKADFACFECDGLVEVRIKTGGEPADVLVKPLARGISASLELGVITFNLNGPQFLCVDASGLKPLFLYANAPETSRPVAGDPGVIYFPAGKVYDAGEIILRSDTTLYIEAGAVVKGWIRSTGASRVSIRGRGILDGSCHDYTLGERIRHVVFDTCTQVLVEDIVMIEPTSWMLVFGACRDVTVRGLKQIGSCMSSDGIDICGSRDVLIENCCLRNDDDNIAIKAGNFEKNVNWEQDIRNIVVRDCVLLNGLPGNAMEIGYELRADRVSDILFDNIDVINAHGEGAVFSIHNGDRAIVENIRWQNIRVDHYWDKLVDLRVIFARYNRDRERGRIRNVQFKNIRVNHSVFNQGCSLSVISGYSDDAPVRDIVFEDFWLGSTKVLNPDTLDLHMRNVEGIRFC